MLLLASGFYNKPQRAFSSALKAQRAMDNNMMIRVKAMWVGDPILYVLVANFGGSPHPSTSSAIKSVAVELQKAPTTVGLKMSS